MSSLSGLDNVAALKTVAFVLPESYRDKVQDHELKDLYIFIEDLLKPSFIITGGMNITMQLQSVKDLITKHPILNDIFGGFVSKADKDTQKVDTPQTEPLVHTEVVQEANPDEGTEMFFRYARSGDPRNEWRAKPRGGLCFLINLMPEEKKLHFSVSVCHPRDSFVRKTARAIATHRMLGNQYYVLENYDDELPILMNIKQAAQNFLKKDAKGDKLVPVLTQVPNYVVKQHNQEVRYISQRT